MSDGLGLLTAVYRDGRVHLGGKSYAAGTFAVHLLSQYYKGDTAARIAVFRQSKRTTPTPQRNFTKIWSAQSSMLTQQND